MKVLCISDELTSLTKGKWYPVIGFVENNYTIGEKVELYLKYNYLIINDRSHKNWYNKKFFKTQKDVREEKFKELGI